MNGNRNNDSHAFRDSLLIRNPVLHEVIGIAPILAVTVSVKAGLLLSIMMSCSLLITQTLTVTVFKRFVQPLRMLLFFLVGSAVSLTALAVTEKLFPVLSTELGLYLPLTAVSSFTALHCERYAVNKKQGVLSRDTLSSAVGYSVITLIISLIREIASMGTVFGFKITSLGISRGYLMPFFALILMGFLFAVFNTVAKKHGLNVNENDVFMEHSVMTEDEPEKSFVAASAGKAMNTFKKTSAFVAGKNAERKKNNQLKRTKKAEDKRLKKERKQKERERIAAEKEQKRIAAEKEQKRIAAEKEKERIAAEKLEKERLEKERIEKERLEQERLEQERLEQERLEQERLEKERLEQERLEKERLEQERLEKERLEQERLEQERLEQERLEQERLEQERLEKERLEQERLEQERLEQERLEKERLEQERLEKERLEIERLKQELRSHKPIEQEVYELDKIKKERKELEKLVRDSRDYASRSAKKSDSEAYAEGKFGEAAIVPSTEESVGTEKVEKTAVARSAEGAVGTESVDETVIARSAEGAIGTESTDETVIARSAEDTAEQASTADIKRKNDVRESVPVANDEKRVDKLSANAPLSRAEEILRMREQLEHERLAKKAVMQEERRRKRMKLPPLSAEEIRALTEREPEAPQDSGEQKTERKVKKPSNPFIMPLSDDWED